MDKSLNLQICMKDVWKDIITKVNNAIVFMDNASMESCHWNIGANMLLSAGAKNVKDFSSFVHGEDSDRKGVFIVSDLLKGEILATIQNIIIASSFQYVIVITSVCPALHTQITSSSTTENEMKAFHDIEEKLLNWMGDVSFTAEIIYKPFSCAPVAPNVFFIPQHHSFFPLLPSDVESLKHKWSKDDSANAKFNVSYTHLCQEAQLQYKLFVCTLNGLFEQLNVNEDCFSLGLTSHIITSELANLNWAKSRRKSAKTRVSILICDRTLDIPNVIGHHTESLLDKILHVLPKLPGHQVDCQVDMKYLMNTSSNIASGCLAHPKDYSATTLFETLLTTKQKASLMDVNRQLVEAASTCNLSANISTGRVTAKHLSSTLNSFKGSTKSLIRYYSTIQIAQAVVASLNHEKYSVIDNLLAIEKNILQCISDDKPSSALMIINKLLNNELKPKYTKGLYDLEDIFQLIIYIYSLINFQDGDAVENEKLLKSTLEGVLLDSEYLMLPEFLQKIICPNKTEEDVYNALESIFVKLNSLHKVHENLSVFNNILDKGNTYIPGTLNPLFKQVMTKILNPKKPEISDIDYMSTGFRDLLKSSFGLFMNVSKPRPSDHPILIIFIIGGISSNEIKQIKDIVLEHDTNCQVIIGSTKLLRSHDLLHELLVQNNLHSSE